MLKVLDLFSGIGGFSLGLERTGGFETVAFCEIDPYCRAVLAKHWPGVPIFEDVRNLTGDAVGHVDVITGGFPCQDISTVGKQAGLNSGTRSGLWSEISRLSGEIQPQYIIVENVTNLLSGPSEQRGRWFGRVLGDLAEIGFDAEWHCIPASSFGAPHDRDRAWIVAHSNTKKNSGCSIERFFKNNQMPGGNCCGPWGKAVPKVSRMGDGIPGELDRLGALGNSVVPQVVTIIGHAILEAERLT